MQSWELELLHSFQVHSFQIRYSVPQCSSRVPEVLLSSRAIHISSNLVYSFFLIELKNNDKFTILQNFTGLRNVDESLTRIRISLQPGTILQSRNNQVQFYRAGPQKLQLYLHSTEENLSLGFNLHFFPYQLTH